MYTIDVKASTHYKIYIGGGLLGQIGSLILPTLKSKRVVVITDDVVEKLYLKKVTEALLDKGLDVVSFVFKNGEASKSVDTYVAILRFLAEQKIARSDSLVALGGGVVGDIVGFAASTYMRGVDFYGVPTTLLAGIDSSVGGKTAIDLDEGKNLVGSFYQPKAVFFDIDTLKTLPIEQTKNGQGEMIKYGVLLGGELWGILKGGNKTLDARLDDAIKLCVEYKRDIVEEDEKEQGKRRLLNLGHTMAHSVEKLSGFSIQHGEAVAVGLRMIAEASERHGTISHSIYEEICEVLKQYGLYLQSGFSVRELAKAALVDKKVEGQSINLVIINGLGECGVISLPLSDLEGYFDECNG